MMYGSSIDESWKCWNFSDRLIRKFRQDRQNFPTEESAIEKRSIKNRCECGGGQGVGIRLEKKTTDEKPPAFAPGFSFSALIFFSITLKHFDLFFRGKEFSLNASLIGRCLLKLFSDDRDFFFCFFNLLLCGLQLRM